MKGRLRRLLELGYHWLTPFFDPLHAIRSAAGLPRYLNDWRRYSRLINAERLSVLDSYPQLSDWSATTGFDAHYFYMSGWAMRRILSQTPKRHVDVGSHNLFVNLLSAVVPVDFIDIRPLCADIPGLSCLSGSVLCMPFKDCEILSLSCLHVAEHVGLGRYGDPLDSEGTVKAAKELTRVLAPGGNLFFALPVGRSRVCFNAHRIVSPYDVLRMFAGLELIEFSAVDDHGGFHPDAQMEIFSACRYACGMFWFRKKEMR